MTIIELIQARLDQCRSNPQGDVVAVLSELLDAAVALEQRHHNQPTKIQVANEFQKCRRQFSIEEITRIHKLYPMMHTP